MLFCGVMVLILLHTRFKYVFHSISYIWLSYSYEVAICCIMACIKVVHSFPFTLIPHIHLLESLKLKALGYDKKTVFGFLLHSTFLHFKRSSYYENSICTTPQFSCCCCLFCFFLKHALPSLAISRRFIFVAFAKESHTLSHT